MSEVILQLTKKGNALKTYFSYFLMYDYLKDFF